MDQKKPQEINRLAQEPTGGALNTQVQSNQTILTRTAPTANGAKIIKRYQNRKLYDTQQSCYVTLEDIAKMIRASEEVMVIDNKTKRDITAATLTQIIFEAEKKASEYAPLITLREIIQYGNGSISSYLAKLGAFPANAARPGADTRVDFGVTESARGSYDDVKSGLDQRLSNARAETSASRSSTGTGSLESEETPELPGSNKSLNN